MNMNAETHARDNYIVEFLADEVHFDPLSLCSTALFTQSDLYYRWQRAAGKTSLRFLVKDGGRVVAYAQCFFSAARFLGGRGYWYAPYGPVCIENIDYAGVIYAIRSAFAARGDVFFRCDFFPVLASHQGTVPHFATRFLNDGSVQPRSEWILPLLENEASLIAGMHQKARYSIQYAQRKGVQVLVVSRDLSAYVDVFCALMRETAKRDHFVPHLDVYYRALFAEIEGTDHGFLVIASYAGAVISAALVLGYGKLATYVFGASSDLHRNVSAPALVQWQAILEAKRRGYEAYSFGGVSSERFPMKTWNGITTFKRRFGGRGVDHSPVVDIVFRPGWYLLYLVRKWARRYLHI